MGTGEGEVYEVWWEGVCIGVFGVPPSSSTDAMSLCSICGKVATFSCSGCKDAPAIKETPELLDTALLNVKRQISPNIICSANDSRHGSCCTAQELCFKLSSTCTARGSMTS